MGTPIKKDNRMKISYDQETDTFYIFFSDTSNSVARDMGNGILVQFNLDTEKPVATIIHDFMKRFKGKETPFVLPIHPSKLEEVPA